MNDKFQKAKELTEKYGQQHLLAFYDELNDADKEALLDQILGVNFELVEELYNNAKREEAEGIKQEGEITPIGCVVKDSMPAEELDRYTQIGLEEMKAGRYAAVTMAGGQGTRLGHSGPKGTFFIDIEPKKSLFEIQAMRLAKKHEELGVYIPWYIMTSRENDGATRAFFEENSYFGYDKDSIFFFVQNMLPMIHNDTGKIVLCEKGKIKEGADGHGGIFTAMISSGAMADMKKRGIKWMFIGGIDNVLVRLCDPCFLGYMVQSGKLIGGKSLIKRDPYEKAGVFCMRDGKPYVVEYTEVSDEMANAKYENGEWVYGDAHILCNMFNIEVFDVMGDKGLPYHTAFKKAPYVAENGEIIAPESPNAYKFEAFIFDAFNFFDDMAIFRIKREEEFAPVKNKDGEDSPATAKALFEGCGKDIW